MTTDRVQELRDIAARGESQTVEFKNTTAQLPRAGETLCGMLNSDGGIVLIGVSASGELQGQDVSDSTQQEIARMLDRFQPTAPIELQIALLPDLRRSVIPLEVPQWLRWCSVHLRRSCMATNRHNHLSHAAGAV